MNLILQRDIRQQKLQLVGREKPPRAVMPPVSKRQKRQRRIHRIRVPAFPFLALLLLVCFSLGAQESMRYEGIWVVVVVGVGVDRKCRHCDDVSWFDVQAGGGGDALFGDDGTI